MFYVFHHVPKCGGTSFRSFLSSIFNVVDDYQGDFGLRDRWRFEEYIQKKRVNLKKLTRDDCLCGHYNVPRIRLWERYPNLVEAEHRKFSILRQPLDAAISGIRYSQKIGLAPKDLPKSKLTSLLLSRVGYYSTLFGVSRKEDIDSVFGDYWFIAPLDFIDVAAKVIMAEVGKNGADVPVSNTTGWDLDIPESAISKFCEQNWLDEMIYQRSLIHFESVRNGYGV